MRARKVVRRRQVSKKTSPTPGQAGRGVIRIRISRLGGAVQDLSVPAGATVKDLIKGHDLGESSVRINGKPIRLAMRLKEGDRIVVVPLFIRGAARGRHDHLDLEKYRRTMSPEDFRFFVNYVGAESLGFRDEDLSPL